MDIVAYNMQQHLCVISVIITLALDGSSPRIKNWGPVLPMVAGTELV